MGSHFFPKTISAWNGLAFTEAPSFAVLLILKCEIPCLIYELFLHLHLAVLNSQCRSNIGECCSNQVEVYRSVTKKLVQHRKDEKFVLFASL